MAEETMTEAPAVAQPVEVPRSQERITQLSGELKAEAEARTKAEAAQAEAEKRAQFAEGFSEVIGTYPAAKEFKADIQAKVNQGYSISDAATVVLVEKGKFGVSTAPVVQPAGGSSATVLNQPADKTLGDMNTAEKRQALIDSGLSATELFRPFRG